MRRKKRTSRPNWTDPRSSCGSAIQQLHELSLQQVASRALTSKETSPAANYLRCLQLPQGVPRVRSDIIERNPLPLLVQIAEIGLRRGITLLRGQPCPLCCFTVIADRRPDRCSTGRPDQLVLSQSLSPLPPGTTSRLLCNHDGCPGPACTTKRDCTGRRSARAPPLRDTTRTPPLDLSALLAHGGTNWRDYLRRSHCPEKLPPGIALRP